MNRRYSQASELERTFPNKALELYRVLEKENTRFHLDIVLVGIIGSAIGFIVAYYSHHPLTRLVLFLYGRYFKEFRKKGIPGFEVQEVETFSILIIWSIITSISLAIRVLPASMRARLKVREKWGVGDLISWTPIVFIIVIASYLIILAVGLMGGVTNVLTDFLGRFSTGKVGEVIKVLLSLGLLELFINPVERLRLRRREIRFGFLMAGLLILMFAYGFIEGVVASACIGAVISFYCARIDKEPVLANLLKIGQSRCLIRLGRNFEASFLLSKDLNPLGITRPINCLADTVCSLAVFIKHKAKNRPWTENYLDEECAVELLKARNLARAPDHHEYISLFEDSIRRTEELAKEMRMIDR